MVELDRDAYGPDQHLVEWFRTASTEENDGFTVCVAEGRGGEGEAVCISHVM